MSLTRREFLQLLSVAAGHGLDLGSRTAFAASSIGNLYDLGKPAGNVALMHFTDCHAQLLPVYFREPDVNLGLHDSYGRPPHLVGEALLRHFSIAPGTPLAHAFTHLDFESAATLPPVQDDRLKASTRPSAHARSIRTYTLRSDNEE